MGKTGASLTLGVIGTSLKEGERRVPLHPAHLAAIPEELKAAITFEQGYGAPFHLDDAELGQGFAGFASREALFATCDVVLMPKPTEGDFAFFRDDLVLWGWPHCVQGEAITELAIARRMTIIAWEVTNLWNPDGSYRSHVFWANNELAGYCAVMHAQQLAGFTGHYGRRRRVAVVGFGLVGVGAVKALLALGYDDVTVFLPDGQGPAHPVPDGVSVRRFVRETGDARRTVALSADGGRVPMAAELAGCDVIVNAILQDPNAPYMFIEGASELAALAPGTLVVDVSCDEAMGFDFAKPTRFARPSFEVGRGVTYYGVDHTPSLLWESASYEISAALLPYLPVVMGGPEAWDASDTIRRAIEIDRGVVQNPAILRFQNRVETYPHAKR